MKDDPKEYGKPPEEMIVGRRRYISYESAARWRKQREAAARKAASKKTTVKK
jgi:hypothetical protein